MYTYYKEVRSEEHMLYANEIIEVFKESLPETITPIKIHSIIREHCANCGVEDPKLYYNTRNGHKKVYPYSLWYPALIRFIAIN